ncbi:MAG: VWA domain-containing protein [Gammaproteobacteria bacterium]|nr:VWA domain-containing protein [Gammaproteobacteria bacterium]
MDSCRTLNARFANPLAVLPFLLFSHTADAETFSIVVLPDTQFYTQDNPDIFDTQTAWIRTNQAAENIIYVAHLGDIVDSAGCNSTATEWANADGSMDVLDGAATTADDIPYGVLPGNHDFDPLPASTLCSTARDQYDATFGPSRYPPAGTLWYGGSQDSANTHNNYTMFSSPEGVDFIAINLAYSDQVGATEVDILDWADDLLKTNPNRIGIVTSHFIMSDARTGGPGCELDDDLGTYGSAIWDELKDNPNLSLLLSGHCRGEKWVTFEGGGVERPGCLGDVHGLMSNYQAYESSESGYMRIMRFDTDTREISVDTFTNEAGLPASSPGTAASMDTTSVSSFTFDYDTTVSSCSDVALAMDRSGSMNGASAVAGTKLDALKNAADLFVDQISFDERHRLAMVQFNGALVPFAVPEVPFVTLDGSNVGDAHTVISSIDGGGSTNILDGLQGGVDKLDVVSPNERSVVVLFTDGKHNTPSVLSDAALETELNTRINSVDPDMELYSLGFGTSISDVALSGAANSNSGWHVNEVDPIVVAKSFSLVAARVMEDAVLSDPLYLIKPGDTQTHRFGVSKADKNLTIVTHWDDPSSNRVSVKVEPPAGAACAIDATTSVSGVKQASGKTYRLLRVDLPYDCDGSYVREGEWQVHMTANNEPRKPERVDVLAYAASDIGLQAKVELSGDQINIVALLDGAVIKDATFTAYVMPPFAERGDSTRLDELGSSSDGATSIPRLELINREAVAIPLEVGARSVDSIAAKGQFDPDKKGVYQVRVVAELVDASGQVVTREAIASLHNPTAKSSFADKWIWLVALLALLLIVIWVWRSGKSRYTS